MENETPKASPKGYIPVRIPGAPVSRTFLFRTGLTDAIKRPGQELCAVCHRYGHFTLKWMKPPKGTRNVRDWRHSATKAVWFDAPTDPDTGLRQLETTCKCWTGKDGSRAVEDACFVAYASGTVYFDTRGCVTRGKGTEYVDGYENTL